MKTVTLLLLLCIVALCAEAQNLVFNGNFEIYSSCPTGPDIGNKCTGWREYTKGTSDFHHTCGAASVGVPSNSIGYQPAASGNGYIGCVMFDAPTSLINKEYAAGTLTSPMIPGVPYEVSVSVNLANKSGYGTNDIGIFFYDSATYFHTGWLQVLPYTPQVHYSSYGVILDTVNWVRLSKIYYPDSAYDNIVIGGWQAAPSTTMLPTGSPGGMCYYYFDSLVVKDAVTINIAFTEPRLCAGQQVTVPYTINSNLFFKSSNIFSLELSDASGSFNTPTILATQAGTTSGILSATIPSTITPGNGYRLRVAANMPAKVSNISLLPISIGVVQPSKPVITHNTACSGQTLNLSTPNNISGVSYLWSGPNSFVAGVQNPSLANLSLAASGSYTVTATLFGCTAADTATVTVNPTPAVPVISANTPVCPGTNLQLQSGNTIAGTTYHWAGPNGFTATTQNPVATAITTLAAGNYTLYNSLNGCSSPAASVAVAVAITTPTPVATSNSPVCAGGSLQLNAATIPGATFLWTKAGFNSVLQNPVVDPASLQDSGDYIVTANIAGCVSLPDTVHVSITPFSYLGAYVSPNDTVCDGAPITVVTAAVNGGSNPGFQWYKNNQEIQGATSLTYLALTPTMGDTFYCRMTANNTCNTPLTLYSNKIGITVLPRDPSPTIVVTSIPANPMPGNAVTFTATVTNGGTNPTYQWKRNRQDIVGATLNTWSASNLNPYDTISVAVTSSNPCPEDTIVNSNLVGVNFATGIATQGNETLSLYPNPNNGAFTLKGSIRAATVDAEVWNSVGQLVYRATVETKNGFLNEEILLDKNLAAGSYLLKLTTHTEIRTLRFTLNK